jgi:hypothetical protein
MSYAMNPKPLSEVKSGNWYLGTDCSSCDLRIALLDSTPNSDAKLVGGKLLFTCPHCGHRDTYETSVIVNYQA